jgi:hypothetical protein
LVQNPGKVKDSTETDLNGAYVISGLAVGSYLVKVSALGFQRVELSGVYLSPGTCVLDIGLALGRFHPVTPYTISGQARSTTGEQLAGVTLTLLEGHNPSQFRQTRSDSDGEFTFEIWPDGEYVVLATKPGFKLASRNVALQDDMSEVEITLEKATSAPWVPLKSKD